MKKLSAAVLALITVFMMCVPAYADLGESEFDDWYVVCNMDGYTYHGVDYDYETYKETKFTEFIKPGTKYMVHSFYNKTYTLLLQNDDPNYQSLASIIDVSESDFKKYFIDENKPVDKEKGTKLENEVKGTVSTKSGVLLRQGPATTFKSYLTVPNGANVSYLYTHKYDGKNWGYVTYKNKSGWLCIDYVKEAEITTTTSTTTTTTSSADTTAEQTTEATVPNNETSAKAESFFGDTKSAIIICCLGALIIILMAVIILLIIREKRNRKNNNNDNHINNY